MDRTAKSVLWVLSWSLSFSLMMSLIKLVNNEMNPLSIAYLRLTFGFFVCLPLYLRGGFRSLKTPILNLHFIRMLFYCSSMLLAFYAYSHLPLSIATTVGFSGPLFTLCLTVLLLKEKVTKQHWLLVILGYIGVITALRPTEITWEIGIFASLVSNIFAALNLITLKKISRTQSPEQIMFWANLLSFVLFSFFAPWFWQMPQLSQMPVLLAIGTFGVFSQYSYVKAISYGSPVLVAPFEFSRLLFAIPLGIYFFAEQLQLWTVIGAVLIVLANFGIALLNKKRESSNVQTV